MDAPAQKDPYLNSPLSSFILLSFYDIYATAQWYWQAIIRID